MLEKVLSLQEKAVYSTKNGGHFGLNLGKYVHFTSPIRRYADLMVHRAIISLIENDAALYDYSSTELDSIAQEISDIERESGKAERDTIEHYREHIKKSAVVDKNRGRGFFSS